ncbi:2-phospho-L-lactate guanylyltransferase [Natronomonas gomsonensis]|uniref:2-phospho-L-lactate guanylyltransferase n=1 Tax=Natronomonas gomsonensis TaxID=1046043 RepID=UPI0020CA6B2C|nr:2-phospho-L-lactate guanylyltransferase [Natronomonas gomsonensis]MCY4730040.1 2-phospho-L-lactate guanylyltransferase [Natronomonas gomsonensis]
MEVIIPFSIKSPKTRLKPALSANERKRFAKSMLSDVLTALAETDASPTILATGPVDCDAPVVIDQRDLDTAITDQLADSSFPVAIVMADLPLVTPTALERLFEPDADIVLAPGRGGGTNAIVVRHPEFRVDYHGISIRDHRTIAKNVDAEVGEIDSLRLSTDIDEPQDFAEVLLHSNGAANEWLTSAGFELAADGRVTVERQ